MQDKLALELEYLQRQSLWQDLKVIAGTLRAIVQ
jgi:lipopolysaccharide/colanic/teichoic acid biosynthesis glycosyltransferase